MEVLAGKESNLIHASSTFPTLYSIVEELIFNSLDAKANKIEIGINKTTFEIYIRDNGHGISSQLLYAGLGQVEYTTKDRNKNVNSYGYRGESLKLLSALSSDVIMISRYKESTHTYQKILKNTHSQSINLLPNYIWPTASTTNTNNNSNNNNTSTPSSSTGGCSGTIIRLINLYQNLPVRCISLQINQEINKIKQLVYKLSLLYHKISFQFYSTHNQKGQNYKSYINLYTQVSVTARFKEIHNIDIIRDVVVSYNYTYYIIIHLYYILSYAHTILTITMYMSYITSNYTLLNYTILYSTIHIIYYYILYTHVLYIALTRYIIHYAILQLYSASPPHTVITL